MSSVTLTVEGMSCNHCVSRVKKSVGALGGVSRVEVSLEEKKVVVDYDPSAVAESRIRQAIEDLGYDVVS